MKLALELALDGADAQEWMQRLQVGDEQQRVLLAFELLQRGFKPLQLRVVSGQDVCQRFVRA